MSTTMLSKNLAQTKLILELFPQLGEKMNAIIAKKILDNHERGIKDLGI